MSEPRAWEEYPLGDLVERRLERNRVGCGNVLTISAVHGLVSQTEYFGRQVASADLRPYFVLRPGDFAYNKSYSEGYPVGAIRAFEGPELGVVSPLYICFRPLPDRFDVEFARQYFGAGMIDPHLAFVAKEGARNHGLLNVGINDFYRAPVRLPAVSEQRRISEILSLAEKQGKLARRSLAKLEQLRVAVLRKLLPTDAGGKEWSGWKWAPLRDLVHIGSGTTPSRAYKGYWSRGTVPWVKTGEVKSGVIYETSEKITKAAVSDSGLRIYPEKTVLMAMYGQGATRGRVAMLGIPATINQACAALVAIRDDIESAYLFHVLRSQYEDLRALSQGSHQSNLNASLLAQYRIPVPPHYRQQLAIAQHLGEIDDAITCEVRVMKKAEALSRSLALSLMQNEIKIPLKDAS